MRISDWSSDVCSSDSNSFGYSPDCIQTEICLAKPSMGIDMAIPIGLIVNELVTNSFKHAFQEIATPRIVVSLQDKKESRELMVADNGNGIGDPGKLKKTDRSEEYTSELQSLMRIS